MPPDDRMFRCPDWAIRQGLKAYATPAKAAAPRLLPSWRASTYVPANASAWANRKTTL